LVLNKEIEGKVIPKMSGEIFRDKLNGQQI
jgi:hypothetical protein